VSTYTHSSSTEMENNSMLKEELKWERNIKKELMQVQRIQQEKKTGCNCPGDEWAF